VTYSRRVRGRVWVPLVVAVAVQLAGVVAVFTWVAGDDLHEAPLGVVAPAVVGQTLADRAAADPDSPFTVVRPPSAAAARGLVDDGTLVGAAVVDLARSDDVLLLPRRASPDQRAAVEAAVRVTSARLGRGVQVELVGPSLSAGGRAAVTWLPVLAVGAGILTSGVLTVRSGRLPRTWPGALRRLRVIGAVAVLVGGVGGLVGALLATGPVLLWWPALSLLVLTGALVSQALEHLMDAWGWGLAVTLLVLTALPDLAGTGTWMQPVVWREVTTLLPHAAGIEILQQLTGGTAGALWRPWAVLAVWCAVGGATSTLARRERSAG
jgi:hypothetical protein